MAAEWGAYYERTTANRDRGGAAAGTDGHVSCRLSGRACGAGDACAHSFGRARSHTHTYPRAHAHTYAGAHPGLPDRGGRSGNP